MKKYLSLFILLILLSSCATSFNSFASLESIGDAETANDDLKITIGLQPLGDNSRFKDKADEKKITFLKLNVENISEENITIKNSNIYLRGVANNSPISQLSSLEVADRMSLATGSYWLWCLLWLGYHSETNGEVSSTWLPIGLPIAAINFFKAQNTNDSFEEELTKYSFKDIELSKQSSNSGLLFFNRSGGVNYNLVIEYQKNDQLKVISLPYKF